MLNKERNNSMMKLFTFKERQEIEDMAKERMNVCLDCDRYENLLNRCKECGCFLTIKTRMKHLHCPLKKW